MHRIYEDGVWLWNWLTKQGASRATVILMFFTAWYVLLTRGMVNSPWCKQLNSRRSGIEA